MHAAVAPAFLVFAQAMQIDVIVELRGEPRHVEAEPHRVALEMLELQVRLVLEQQVVHLPELALLTGTFGRLGRELRVRVHLLEREVAECEAHAVLEAPEQQPYRRRGLLAVRAFEIAVLDDRDGCMIGPEHVVGRTDRDRQVEGCVPVHRSLRLMARAAADAPHDLSTIDAGAQGLTRPFPPSQGHSPCQGARSQPLSTSRSSMRYWL